MNIFKLGKTYLGCLIILNSYLESTINPCLLIDALNTSDGIQFADADTSKLEEGKKDLEEKTVEKVETTEDEPKVDEKGDADKPKELEPEDKEIKKTDDAVVIETQAEVTAQ